MTARPPENSKRTREAARAQFLAFAEIYTLGTSPLYEALSRIVLEHEALLDLAAGTRPGQPPPNMLFGAVQLLLLSDHPNTELSRLFSQAAVQTPEVHALERAFLAFCRNHRERLAEIIAARVTNTNEVGRSACLMPAFVEASRQFEGAPFHLVEIGPSAGLNLIWDRYAYRYPAQDGTVLRAGDENADALVLECALRGSGRPAFGAHWPPSVASRLGIERDPVDLTDPQERLWLRALVWPEHRERAERLERALGLAAADPPPIRQGDVLERLPEILAGLQPGEPVCVEHSFVFSQFTPEERAAVGDMLSAAARERPLARISYESQADHPEALLVLQNVNEGKVRRLAFCDPHGAWLKWLEPSGMLS